MNLLKIVLGVVAGLVAITIVTESIEFLIVKLASGASFEVLSSDQAYYFSIRNHWAILASKMFYTGASGFVGGYIATKIAKSLAGICISIIIVIQLISLVWAGFVSDLSGTGPKWMWIGLMIVVPAGVYLGYKLTFSKEY